MTTTFAITRNQLIEASLRLLGRLGEGMVPSAEDYVNCTQALNTMFKSWADQGYKGWLFETLQRPFVANQASYLLGPATIPTTNRPQRIPQAWWQDTQNPQNKQEIIMCARSVFDRLTPQSLPGYAPTNGYYDAQLVNGVFYPWPVPNHTAGTFYLTSQRPIEDILIAGDSVQLPQTWFRAAKWGLADEVGLEYRPHPDVLDRIERKASIYLKACADLEEEQESVMFKPSPFPFYGPGTN